MVPSRLRRAMIVSATKESTAAISDAASDLGSRLRRGYGDAARKRSAGRWIADRRPIDECPAACCRHHEVADPVTVAVRIHGEGTTAGVDAGRNRHPVVGFQIHRAAGGVDGGVDGDRIGRVDVQAARAHVDRRVDVDRAAGRIDFDGFQFRVAAHLAVEFDVAAGVDGQRYGGMLACIIVGGNLCGGQSGVVDCRLVNQTVDKPESPAMRLSTDLQRCRCVLKRRRTTTGCRAGGCTVDVKVDRIAVTNRGDMMPRAQTDRARTVEKPLA